MTATAVHGIELDALAEAAVASEAAVEETPSPPVAPEPAPLPPDPDELAPLDLTPPEPAQADEAYPGVGALILRTLVSLAVIVVMIVGVVWFLKRASGGGMVGAVRGNMRVLDRLAVSPKRFVLIVQIPSRILLVGSDERGLSLLGEITDPEEMKRYAQGIETYPVFSDELRTSMDSQDLGGREPSRYRTLRRMQSDLDRL